MSENKEYNLNLQPVSKQVWSMKYQLKDSNENKIDKNISDTFSRVARKIASVEKEEDREYWTERFMHAMTHGSIPAGRILSNIGAEEYKPETSAINCTVSGTIADNMNDIFSKLHEAAITLKAGCGIGYEFSTLRPRGSFVNGAGAKTSGPLSFMDVYDKMCFTVSSAGGRRGAQMATFSIRHPDVVEFIQAKREDGVLRNFNLSILIDDSFMDAVKNDEVWDFAFPMLNSEVGGSEETILLPAKDFYPCDPSAAHNDEFIYEGDKVVCKVYSSMDATEIWNLIMRSTYDFAEPGFLLVDEANRKNNLWFCENFRATNPCSEQWLPPYGACLLGSINLTKFVVNEFTDDAYFDYESYKEVVRIFTRMLDNVVELNGLPVDGQVKEILRKRRHGMGYFGLGSVFTMMKMKYGDQRSIELTESVSETMAIEGIKAGIELAIEKGPAPICDELFHFNKDDIEVTFKENFNGKSFSDLQEEYGSEDELFICMNGSHLIALSNYEVIKNSKTIQDLIIEHGIRFTHHTSIAPTGTIALSLGNNASNGIEPSFEHANVRNMIVEGRKTKQKVEVNSYEFLRYKEVVDPNATVDNLPDYFITAGSISPSAHIDIQAAAQKYIDSSISKTINVASDFPFNEFQDIYMKAYEKNLKGCTTFRFNPEHFQGVLTTEKDLEETTYEFILSDGEKVTAKGNDIIEYDGATHTAANLADAIKEGYYGKI